MAFYLLATHTLFVAYYERLFLKHSFFFLNGFLGRLFVEALPLLCLLEELANKY
jgi:hypothetical protein